MVKGRSAVPPPHAPAPRRVLGYARVSSIAQEEHGTSLDGQRAELERYCSARGLPAPDVHVEVESGGSERIERRHELKRLVAAARPGDLVIVAKVDRWSRDIVYAVQSVRALVAAGVGWISVGEGIDATTPNGDSMLGIMAWAADNERRRIKERMVGTRQRLRAEGYFVEGEPPFGYRPDRETRKLVIDEEKAAIVRDLFAWSIEGLSLADMAAACAEKYPGVGGLDRSAISRKIRDRAYLGEMRPSARKGVRAKPGDAWIAGAHPAIVDRKTWLRAAAALDGRKMSGRPAGAESRSAQHLLRGLARCGVCGATLAAHHPGENTSTKHGGWYLCRGRTDSKRAARPCPEGPIAPHKAIDAIADAATLAHLHDLAGLLARAEPARPATTPPKANYAARRAKVAGEEARVVDAIADGTISRAQARTKLAALEGRLATIDREEAQQEPATPVRPRRERLAEVKALARAWAEFTVDEKRTTLAALAESIVITRAGKLRIMWRES